MAGMKIVKETHDATVTLDGIEAKRLGREPGNYPCLVYDIYQLADGGEAYPVAVCILDDGNVAVVYVSNIRYTTYRRGGASCR